ncbi:MAG: NnrU family protein [Gemmatimonadaceae bacterium]|nr:NnrU family protein [Acetobacteraceae bacterium]
MIALILASLAFIGIHLGVSGTTMRDGVVGRIGLRGYMIAFSVASVAAIAWLVGSYNSAAYVQVWAAPEWWKVVAIVLMLPAFLLVIVGLTTPNPTAVAQEGLVDQPPRGIVRITRHPFLVGVAIWGLVHVIANGDMASVLFFAALAIVSVAGTVSIDAKRRRVLGDAAWDRFASRTSIVPFAAILSGRNELMWREIGWWRPLAGVVAYALFLGGHVHIVGVSPWPN